MKVIALIMGGGKGTRMTSKEEKTLILLNGKPIIYWVIDAIHAAKNVKELIITTSDASSETREYVKQLGIKTIDTPGKGFHEDMKHAILTEKIMDHVLVVAGDLPLLTGELIDTIVDYYATLEIPSMAVMVPLEVFIKHDLTPSIIFTVDEKQVVPVGVNINDGNHILKKKIDQEIMIVEDVRLACNVNTLKDLSVAKALFQRLRKDI
ncbi:MAG: NTP transferase domain-containing protein [Promethearchaeota archaeon]